MAAARRYTYPIPCSLGMYFYGRPRARTVGGWREGTVLFLWWLVHTRRRASERFLLWSSLCAWFFDARGRFAGDEGYCAGGTLLCRNFAFDFLFISLERGYFSVGRSLCWVWGFFTGLKVCGMYAAFIVYEWWHLFVGRLGYRWSIVMHTLQWFRFYTFSNRIMKLKECVRAYSRWKLHKHSFVMLQTDPIYLLEDNSLNIETDEKSRSRIWNTFQQSMQSFGKIKILVTTYFFTLFWTLKVFAFR